MAEGEKLLLDRPWFDEPEGRSLELVPVDDIAGWTTTGDFWHALRPPDGYVHLGSGYYMPVWERR